MFLVICQRMKLNLRVTLAILLIAFQASWAGIIQRDTAAEIAAQAQFEEEARVETEKLLNELFRAQIDFFGKVRQSLGKDTIRFQDMGRYNIRLQEAINEKDVKEKDRMWRRTFEEFSKSPLLLNNQTETHLTKDEYESLLQQHGLKQVIEDFFMEVTKYFWKMAQASGKVMEVTIEEQLANLRKIEYKSFMFF